MQHKIMILFSDLFIPMQYKIILLFSNLFIAMQYEIILFGASPSQEKSMNIVISKSLKCQKTILEVQCIRNVTLKMHVKWTQLVHFLNLSRNHDKFYSSLLSMEHQSTKWSFMATTRRWPS